MLGQQGFQLAQADVGHRQQQQAQSSGSQGFGERGGQGGREGLAGNGQGDATAPAAVVRVARGLVDAYA
jgi:flagellar hook-length control protein FliK